MYLMEEVVKSASVKSLKVVKGVWLEAKAELQLGVGRQLGNRPPQSDPEPSGAALEAK